MPGLSGCGPVPRCPHGHEEADGLPTGWRWRAFPCLSHARCLSRCRLFLYRLSRSVHYKRQVASGGRFLLREGCNVFDLTIPVLTSARLYGVYHPAGLSAREFQACISGCGFLPLRPVPRRQRTGKRAGGRERSCPPAWQGRTIVRDFSCLPTVAIAPVLPAGFGRRTIISCAFPCHRSACPSAGR